MGSPPPPPPVGAPVLEPLHTHSEEHPSLYLHPRATSKRGHDNGAPDRHSQNFLVPFTPHRISVVFLSLAFIVSKSIIASRNFQWVSPALDCIFGMAVFIFGWISLYKTVNSPRWKWWFQTDYSGRVGWIVTFSAVILSSGALLSSIYHVLTSWRYSTSIELPFVMMALTFGLCLVVALPCIMSVLHLREQHKAQDNHDETLDNDDQLHGEPEKS